MAPPALICDKEEMRAWCRAARAGGRTLALVPTMGFLHEGHLSLVRAARDAGADAVAVRLALRPSAPAPCAAPRGAALSPRCAPAQVSIYVNPTQFAPGEDLDVYPRDPEGDHAKLASVGCDAIFEPATLYGAGAPGEAPHETFVTVEQLQARASGGARAGAVESKRADRAHRPPPQLGLCGRSRPTHFRGVATIVTKLFNIVQPDIAARPPRLQRCTHPPHRTAPLTRARAAPPPCRPTAPQVFGRKDYQQFKLLCRMVRDLDVGVRMVGAPLLREPDGLALSSRNVRLRPEERARALAISAALRAAAAAFAAGSRDGAALRAQVAAAIAAAGGDVDYVECVSQDSLTPLTALEVPAVIVVAARFGSVRLLDNMELGGA
jgi:pantoate--beta-alanine ligase